MFRKRQEIRAGKNRAAAVQTGGQAPAFAALRGYTPLHGGELRLYRQLREAVPLIDAALDKIGRLVGGFRVRCAENRAQAPLESFLEQVQVGASGQGMDSFVHAYLDQLLTYGNAVGEMVLQNGELAALYNARLADVELEQVSPLEVQVRRRTATGSEPVPYPELLLQTALNPQPGSALGTSLLQGLPFVSDILLRIFDAIGKNWDRVGNVRFAVSCKPGAEDQGFAQAHAEQIAAEWSRAMQPGSSRDFVAVGDVQIRAIGADNQILDSNVPVRQLLEQMVAKLGVPPFLLGLSWSSTERMSSQQCDILTSELEDYRRLLSPVVGKVCRMWLQLHGYEPALRVEWDEITLQDSTELANADYARARAALCRAQAGAVS